MTNQIDSSSPFGNNNTAEQKTVLETEESLIRTMQDDLLSLQKNPNQFKNPEKNLVSEEKQVEAPQAKSQNEFLGEKPDLMKLHDPSFFKHPSVQKNPKEAMVEVPILEEKIASVKSFLATNGAVHKIIIITIAVFFVIAAGFGLYYFLVTKNQEQTLPIVEEEVLPETLPAEPAIPQQQEEPVAIPEKKYSTKNPNYLSIDIASLNNEEIKNIVISATKELPVLETASLYEFVIVDANNNPIAFPIFATAAKLNLSATILEDLSEKFSLFAYSDKGIVKLSLVANIKEKKELSPKLLSQEKTLPSNLSFLFLDPLPNTIVENVFRSGVYKNASTRFINISNQPAMSIDYSIFNGQLVIGTSKDVFRATIDNLISNSSSASTTETLPLPDNPTNVNTSPSI